MVIRCDLGDNGYDIHVGRGMLSSCGDIFGKGKKYVVVTDDGVPEKYSKTIAENLGGADIFVLPHGEEMKCIEWYTKLLSFMLDIKLTRNDAVVAVGGGVVGDLACFAASTYMRGITFYNIPTTLLSQVDSSIGGKCGIDFGGYKNIVGTFTQPKAVIIDSDVLATLDERNMACGYAEAFKMAITIDRELYSIFSHGMAKDKLDEIIVRSLEIKKTVVEKDEREGDLRRVLNFGHTVGHAIEAREEMHGMLHGECVALGMIPMVAPEMRAEVKSILASLGLPTVYDYAADGIIEAIMHDKKSASDGVNLVFSPAVGQYEIKKLGMGEIKMLLSEV